ncbi:MAG: class I SAM-dependent methyltransferase, partial [Planctomycetota bacterium]|nr:class I SAM-dependent methyltransferase [Planctomycetota bacterium]
CTETDPKLPPDSIDLLIMVDVYHEISDPIPVMAGIHKAMKKDGRVVLVEYRGEDPSIPIKPLHRTTVKQMRGELAATGFRFVANKGDFLPRQHILIFKKK